MTDNTAITEVEERLLLLARSRWTRRVLEEQLMPALGKNKVPLFATAQFNGSAVTRVQALDPASLELTWHEVSCSDTARALHFVHRLPHWDTSDSTDLSDEMHHGTFEELQVAHRVMHSLDVPATSLEVAHRLAHLAPDAAALLGRALSIESQLRQVGNTLSAVANRASGLLSHVSLAVGLTCLVLNSMALNQAIKRRDEVSKATLASSVVLDAASCSFFTIALVAVACKAAKVASIFSTAAIPVSVAALAVPPIVKRLWTKKEASKVACAQLGALMTAVQQPLLKDEALGAHHFSRLVTISEIDFRSKTYTIGAVCIEKTKTLLFGAPKNSNTFLDILDALEVEKVQKMDGTEVAMVLPVSGDLSISWSSHFTASRLSKSSCPEIEEVSKLKEKGFSFRNGLHAIHSVKSAIKDGDIRILLDSKERTFSVAPEEWFPEQADGEQYDICYTFVGCGGRAVVQLEKRQSGYNVVRLESDSENASSTWIIQSSSKLKLGYYTERKFIFAADGVNVVLTDAEKNKLFFVQDDIIFAFNPESRKSYPVVILANWIQSNKNDIMASLKVFDNAVEIQDCTCVDEDGRAIQVPLVYYDPITGCIYADTPNGHHYTCSGAFTDEGSLIFQLDVIDLSRSPSTSYFTLHKVTKTRLSVIVSHLGLQGYFDISSSMLLLKSDEMMLYAFSNSTAALVGVGQDFVTTTAKNVPGADAEFRENVAAKLEAISDPTLFLFPEKRRLIAEHLQVLDSHNLWFLPFEKKLASASSIAGNVQFVGCVNSGAIFFEPVQGAIFSSPLLPFDVDLGIIETHEIYQFPKHGKFSKVETVQDQIFATTSDGLVYRVKSPQHMRLIEKIWQAEDSHSSLCAALENVGKNVLVPVTDKESGTIVVFVDTESKTCVQPMKMRHATSEIVLLGRLCSSDDDKTDSSYVIFSRKLKKLYQLQANSCTILLNCDFAAREKDALLIFDPVLPFDASVYTPLFRMKGINSLIIASSFKSAKITNVFGNFHGSLKLIIDPLINTSPVSIAVHFDEDVQVEKKGHELVVKCGDKIFVVHRGYRENVSVVLE